MRRAVWPILSVILLFTAGCTLKGTIKETTDTTSNVTGTTSGRTWFTEDGLLHPEHKLTAFTALNQANLEQDLARGEGEYVTSLAALLDVPNDRRAAFRVKTQEAFETLVAADHETQIQQLRTLAR